MMRRCFIMVRAGVAAVVVFALVALIALPLAPDTPTAAKSAEAAQVTQIDVTLGSSISHKQSSNAKSTGKGSSAKGKKSSKSRTSKKSSERLSDKERLAVKRASKQLTRAEDVVDTFEEKTSTLADIADELASLSKSIEALEDERDTWRGEHTWTITRLTVADKDTTDIEAALEELSQTGILEILIGQTSFADIAREATELAAERDTHEVVTETVTCAPDEESGTLATYKKRIAAKTKELKCTVKRGNALATTLEEEDSTSRTHDANASETLTETLDEDKDDAQTVLEEAEEVTSEHDNTRSDARDILSEWYGTVDEVSGVKSDLTFGTGIDFSLDEEDFVDKWGSAIDEFYATYAQTYGLEVPLEGYGELMAECAYEYEIDPRLCAAVSIAESSGGVYCIAEHNAWGWGAADSDPAGLAWSWESWEDAIGEWHECMASSTTGLAEAGSVSALGEIYASSPRWAANVTRQMKAISELAEE